MISTPILILSTAICAPLTVATPVLAYSGLVMTEVLFYPLLVAAAWAAIALVPTAIAGIYGMNFDNMPELHWHYGYFVALGWMLVMTIGLFTWFKRKGWL